MIVYNRLWALMIKKGLKVKDLIAHGINRTTVYKLKRNEPTSTKTINQLCELLNCQPSAFLDFVDGCDNNYKYK